MKSEHIQGLTVLEKLTDLDPALVAEGEVDAAYLPPVGAMSAMRAGEKYEQKRARREARAERREVRREENPFFRFLASGAGAVCISLIVAFSLIAGIVYIVNHSPFGIWTPGDAVGGTTGGTPGGTPGGIPADAVETMWEGKIPTDRVRWDYVIRTDKRVYETPPTQITLTLRGQYPGVEITQFESCAIECLTNPDVVVEGFWNDLAVERVEPLGKDEYDVWTKEIEINDAHGAMPEGIYRIHHMEYDTEAGGYVSTAYYNFAVGKEYGYLLGLSEMSSRYDSPLYTLADRDAALLDEFFAARPATDELPVDLTREELWHITPAEMYEATGVRVFKDAKFGYSFLLMDGTLYALPSVGGNGFHNALVCDYDLNGVDDILYTLSWGSGMHRSEVWVFNTETRESHKIFDTSVFLYTDSTLSDSSSFDPRAYANLCAVRIKLALDSESDPQPVFVLCTADANRGEHGFADMRFTDLEYFARLVLTEGGLPTVSMAPVSGDSSNASDSTPSSAPGFTTTADQNEAYLAQLFASDYSGISQIDAGKLNREKLYHITPAGMFEDCGVRLYEYVDGGSSTSYLTVNHTVFDLGMCLSNAIACDLDSDGNVEILLAGTYEEGAEPSIIKLFSLKAMELQRIYTVMLPDAPTKRLVVRPVPESESVTNGVLSGKYALWQADFVCDEENPRICTYENLRLFARLEANAGELPFVRLAGKEPSVSIPAVTDDGYTIEASVAQDAGTGRAMLTVTFRAKWRGTAFLYPHTDVRMYRGTTDEGVSLSGIYAVPGLVPPSEAHDGYAVITQTYKFIDTTLPEGIYRVAAGLRDGPREIDSVAFHWDGTVCRPVEPPYEPPVDPDATTETLAPDEIIPAPGDPVPYHIEAVSFAPNNAGGMKVLITFVADEPGVTVWGPSTEFRLEKIDGEPNPEELLITSTDEAIECVMPSDKYGGYAGWTKTIPPVIQNPAAMLPGTYRITALSWRGEVTDTVEITWDGTSCTLLK